jgi:hypothetical protein
MFPFRSTWHVPSLAMSIHRVQRKAGERFVVRARDANGVNRSRAFVARVDAERYQRKIDAAKAARRERELQNDLERF